MRFHGVCDLICLQATTLSTDAWKGKKVVIVSVPGAFTVRLAFPFNAFSLRLCRAAA